MARRMIGRANPNSWSTPRDDWSWADWRKDENANYNVILAYHQMGLDYIHLHNGD